MAQTNDPKSSGHKSSDPQAGACKFVLCVDPKTGRTVMTPDGECPEGMVKAIEDSIVNEGIEVVVRKRKAPLH